MMAGAGQGISDFDQAVGDLYAAAGSKDAAKAYSQASDMEGENAQIAQASGVIQQAQTRRQVYQVQSSAAAATGNNGLKMSGSAADVVRSNAQQGSLAEGLASAQTQIAVKNYQVQQTAYAGQAKQDTELAKGQEASAAMSAISGVMSFL